MRGSPGDRNRHALREYRPFFTGCLVCEAAYKPAVGVGFGISCADDETFALIDRDVPHVEQSVAVQTVTLLLKGGSHSRKENPGISHITVLRKLKGLLDGHVVDFRIEGGEQGLFSGGALRRGCTPMWRILSRELSGGFLIKHLPDGSPLFRDLVQDDARIGYLRQLHFHRNLSRTISL